MPQREQDPEREHRITMEIVVDAYDEYEQAMGWYYYLDNNLSFPFTARCVRDRPISPVRAGDEVEVIGMAHEDECEHEVFVEIRWESDELAVPLGELEFVRAGTSAGKTEQAISDWHYWVDQGYAF